METFKKYPAISISFALISALVIQAILGGNDILISGAMIQVGLCAKGNYICLLCYYLYAGLAILLMVIIVQIFLSMKSRKKVVALPSAEPQHNSERKKISFQQKQKTATVRISKLINIAVEKSLRFSEGYSLPNEPNPKEQGILAYKAGKELMEYYKSGKNRLYFSDKSRRNITELYELISICIQRMDMAISGNFDKKTWNEYSGKLQKIRTLKDEIDSDFHEFLASSNET
jgi:hypothetical protein